MAQLAQASQTTDSSTRNVEKRGNKSKGHTEKGIRRPSAKPKNS